MKELRVFVRQPFTESGNSEKEVVQGVLDVLRKMDGKPYKLITPTGFEAQSESTFRKAYERTFGKAFTPQNFRATRLENLRNADAMIVIRTGLSESGSFEVAYNIFGGRSVPILFAVWEKAPIKTTLLRELQEIADATYITFQSPEELEAPLHEFLVRARRRRSMLRWFRGAEKKSNGRASVPPAKTVEQAQGPAINGTGCLPEDGRQLRAQSNGQLAVEETKPQAEQPAAGEHPLGAPSARNAVLAGHGGEVTALCVLPDGRLASASRDNTVRLWDLASGREVARLQGHCGPVNGLSVLSDGRLASASDDNTIRLWDTVSCAETGCLPAHGGGVWSLCALPGGRLASVSGDNGLRLWDVAAGSEATPLEGRGRWVTSWCLLPGGRLACASGSHLSNNGAICAWDLATGAMIARLDGHKGLVRALCPLPDGRLASGSDRRTIRLWDLTTGTETARLDGHGGGINALCMLPNGWLASGSDDNTVRLWDLRRGAKATRLEGHTGWITVLCALPSGLLASASADGTVRLWEPGSGAEAGRFEGHGGGITALCPLPDGRLASASLDRTVRVWDTAPASAQSVVLVSVVPPSRGKPLHYRE